VEYTAHGGKRSHIPLGPCLVEQGDDEQVDIIWGAKGQNSTALPVEQLQTAEETGRLVLLD
jgi:hypothetical protein